MPTYQSATLLGTGTAAQAPPPPRPLEDALWTWLDQLVDEAERVKRAEARLEDFDLHVDMYTGKHWRSTMPSFRPPIVANELRTLILSEASDLTEAQLRIYITKDPRAGGRDLAVERAFRAIWAREQVDLKLMQAAVWALIVGTGFVKTYWDPDEANGLGDVCVTDVDPRDIIPDPDAVDDHTWQYVIEAPVMDIVEIRRLFPLSGWRVRPEDKFSVKQSQNSRDPNPGSASYIGPMTGTDSLTAGTIAGYKKARARVIDLKINDPQVETVVEEVTGSDGRPVLGEDGAPIIREFIRAKYPYGRRIVGANGVILFDGDNPNRKAGGRPDFGILRVIVEPTLSTFWGQGFAQQTAELQLAADKMLSNNVENSIRLNNGIVVSTTNTGLDWESFAGIPAQIVQINPGSEFHIQYPPPMPPNMIDAPWRMLDLQRRILGFPDSRAGVPGRGNVSADLTETEIAQAQSTTRLRARLLYYTVQRLAEMIFARLANGYMTPRMIPAVEGEQFKPVEWQPLERPERYSIYVDPASFMVMSRTMLRRLGLALYKMKAVDRRALLESLSWPDWEQVAGRIDQAEKLAALARIQQKQRGTKG